MCVCSLTVFSLSFLPVTQGKRTEAQSVNLIAKLYSCLPITCTAHHARCCLGETERQRWHRAQGNGNYKLSAATDIVLLSKTTSGCCPFGSLLKSRGSFIQIIPSRLKMVHVSVLILVTCFSIHAMPIHFHKKSA